MAVTAKVKVVSKNESGAGDDRQATLTIGADYAAEQNKEWAKWTPRLSLTMTVKGVVADKFLPGQAYTLTFTLDDEDDELAAVVATGEEADAVLAAESPAVEQTAAPDAPAV